MVKPLKFFWKVINELRNLYSNDGGWDKQPFHLLSQWPVTNGEQYIANDKLTKNSFRQNTNATVDMANSFAGK